jgi:metal-responsive CopG/Arc/MetJ family transcriptional regulator
MKAIQVVLDEDLLDRLDASKEVKAEGRSAVLRRATAEYLARRRREAISNQYRKAYSDGPGLGEESEGWEKQGSWREDALGA